MKYFLSTVLLFVTLASKAQVQNPALISIEGFGGDKRELVRSLTQAPSGGFILGLLSESRTGNINTTCYPDDRIIFQKYRGDMTLEWEKCSIVSGDSLFDHMFEDIDGDYVLGGARTLTTMNRSLLLRKQNSKGDVFWSKDYGGSNIEKLETIIATSDGGYILLGQSSSADGDVGTNYGDYDIWALKVDTDGNIIWSKVFGGSGEDSPYNIVPGPDNGFYIVGSTGSGDHDALGYHGGADAFVVRIDKDGNKIWSRCLGGSGLDGYYVAGCSDGSGGVIIANGSNSTDGDIQGNLGVRDIWVVNVDSANNIVWTNNFGALANGESPYSACLGTDGTIWIGGICGAKGEYVDDSFGNGDAWVFNIDNKGKFLKGKVLGSHERDQIDIVYPLTGGMILAGGTYEAPGANSSEFPSTGYGAQDIFLTILAPWTTGIANIKNDSAIELFPNPATDRVTIRGIEGDILTATDAVGSKVYTAGFSENNHQINVSTWPRGMYYLQVIKFTGERITKALSLV